MPSISTGAREHAQNPACPAHDPSAWQVQSAGVRMAVRAPPDIEAAQVVTTEHWPPTAMPPRAQFERSYVAPLPFTSGGAVVHRHTGSTPVTRPVAGSQVYVEGEPCTMSPGAHVAVTAHDAPPTRLEHEEVENVAPLCEVMVSGGHVHVNVAGVSVPARHDSDSADTRNGELHAGGHDVPDAIPPPEPHDMALDTRGSVQALGSHTRPGVGADHMPVERQM